MNASNGKIQSLLSKKLEVCSVFSLIKMGCQIVFMIKIHIMFTTFFRMTQNKLKTALRINFFHVSNVL